MARRIVSIAVLASWLVIIAGCGSEEAAEPNPTGESTPATAETSDTSQGGASRTPGSGSSVESPGRGTCPDDADEVIESDIDGDGALDRVYLRRDSETSANNLGVCSDGRLSVPEIDVGGMATSLAGVFDVDRDGDQEIFVFDTSARSVIYSAATLTPEGLVMTTLLLERTIDTESGEAFNATAFRCEEGSDGTELIYARYVAIAEIQKVTTASIGLDGLSMTENLIEAGEADPAEALDDWRRPDQCFHRFVGFDKASAQLSAALDDLGYEQLGGDHPGKESSSFLAGRGGNEELQIITGWNLSGPQGTYEGEAGPNQDGHLEPIRRGDRIGVWTTCGRFYFEILSLEDQPATAETTAEEIQDAICSS